MVKLRYELEDDIAEAPCFSFKTHVCERRIEKQKKLLLDHETLQGKPIISEDSVERALTIGVL